MLCTALILYLSFVSCCSDHVSCVSRQGGRCWTLSVNILYMSLESTKYPQIQSKSIDCVIISAKKTTVLGIKEKQKKLNIEKEINSLYFLLC